MTVATIIGGEYVLLDDSYQKDWSNHSNQVPEDHGDTWLFWRYQEPGFTSHVMASQISKTLWRLNVTREWELYLNTNKTTILGKT